MPHVTCDSPSNSVLSLRHARRSRTCGRRSARRTGSSRCSHVQLRAESEEKLMSADRMSDLKPMTEGIVPIPVEERQRRVEKARRRMAENHIEAMILEPGSSLFYFTGIRWGRSERMMVAILPVKGGMVYVCPGFEEE